jgi:hypothetical protein
MRKENASATDVARFGFDTKQCTVHDFFDGARQIQKGKANLSKPYISLLINSRYKRHDN